MKALFQFVLVLTLACTGTAFAQKGKKTEPASAPATSQKPYQAQAKHYRDVYEQALRFGDMGIATQSVYDLMALDPEFGHYIDTLALLYFQRGAWAQTAAVADKILSTSPNAEGPLELRAVAYHTMGLLKESLTDYERLYGISKNTYHLYEIAALQYTLRRFGECDQTLGRLLNDPGLKDKEIQLSAGQQQTQTVPLVAACNNMVGVLLMEQGKKAEAKLAFQEALKMFPDFVLAKNNLTELSKP